MSWTAARKGADRVDVTGPVGDTLAIHVSSTVLPAAGWDWTGWTFTGQVRPTEDGDVVATYAFTDSSTSTELDVVGKIVDTTSWEEGASWVHSWLATKGSEKYALFSWLVLPTPRLVVP